MAIALIESVHHNWYQDTTESLNFFIFLMAMVPPAERNWFANRRMYKTK